MRASDPLAMELVRWIAAAALVAVLSAVIFLRTAKGRRPTPKRRARRDGPYTAGWMDADEGRHLLGRTSGLLVGPLPGGHLSIRSGPCRGRVSQQVLIRVVQDSIKKK